MPPGRLPRTRIPGWYRAKSAGIQDILRLVQTRSYLPGAARPRAALVRPPWKLLWTLASTARYRIGAAVLLLAGRGCLAARSGAACVPPCWQSERSEWDAGLGLGREPISIRRAPEMFFRCQAVRSAAWTLDCSRKTANRQPAWPGRAGGPPVLSICHNPPINHKNGAMDDPLRSPPPFPPSPKPGRLGPGSSRRPSCGSAGPSFLRGLSRRRIHVLSRLATLRRAAAGKFDVLVRRSVAGLRWSGRESCLDAARRRRTVPGRVGICAGHLFRPLDHLRLLRFHRPRPRRPSEALSSSPAFDPAGCSGGYAPARLSNA